MSKTIRINGKVVEDNTVEQYNEETEQWEPYFADSDSGILSFGKYAGDMAVVFSILLQLAKEGVEIVGVEKNSNNLTGDIDKIWSAGDFEPTLVPAFTDSRLGTLTLTTKSKLVQKLAIKGTTFYADKDYVLKQDVRTEVNFKANIGLGNKKGYVTLKSDGTIRIEASFLFDVRGSAKPYLRWDPIK